MSEPTGAPGLDDVMQSAEQAPRDRQEHAKAPTKPDDDELEHRTEQERLAAGVDDYDPDEVPPATE
jgi:hypothetical protein